MKKADVPLMGFPLFVLYPMRNLHLATDLNLYTLFRNFFILRTPSTPTMAKPVY